MLDLPEQQLRIVQNILKEHVPECEVRAFGSRVKGTAKGYSDLDLAVVGGGALEFRSLRLLEEAFQESDLPIRVDVLDWHSISPSFQQVIAKEYVVVQAGQGKKRGIGGSEGRVGMGVSEWKEFLFLFSSIKCHGNVHLDNILNVFRLNAVATAIAIVSVQRSSISDFTISMDSYSDRGGAASRISPTIAPMVSWFSLN